MDNLDRAVVDHLESRLLDSPAPGSDDAPAARRREEWVERRQGHIGESRKRAAEAEAKPKCLHEAIENGVVNVADPSLWDRVSELTTLRDQTQADTEHAAKAIERLRPSAGFEPLTFGCGGQKPSPHAIWI